MGLKRVGSDGSSFMYFNNHTDDGTVSVVIVENNNSFSVKVNEKSEGVVKWSRNLKKEPQEYVALLNEALEGPEEAKEKEGSAKGSNGSKTKGLTKDKDGSSKEAAKCGRREDIFEVQEGWLVWKQFFADQKVYGKLGKFKMEKIDYETAIKECLVGAVNDLEAKSESIIKLQKQSQEMSRNLNQAMDLAAKSVKAKEDFEKEIYGKCSSLINAKKHRILQLKSTNRPGPSSAIDVTSSSESGLFSPERTCEPKGPPKKKPRVHNSNPPSGSDGYSSDTDIDDVDAVIELSSDEDTQPTLASTSKAQKPHKSVPAQVLDSQELFNDSLEAELFPTGSLANRGKAKNGMSAENGAKKPQLSESKPGTHSQHLTLGSESSAEPREEPERSIFEELFN